MSYHSIQVSNIEGVNRFLSDNIFRETFSCYLQSKTGKIEVKICSCVSKKVREKKQSLALAYCMLHRICTVV